MNSSFSSYFWPARNKIFCAVSALSTFFALLQMRLTLDSPRENRSLHTPIFIPPSRAATILSSFSMLTPSRRPCRPFLRSSGGSVLSLRTKKSEGICLRRKSAICTSRSMAANVARSMFLLLSPLSASDAISDRVFRSSSLSLSMMPRW